MPSAWPFRRSHKTKDRKPSDRRLEDIKGQVGSLDASDDAKLGFEVVAIRDKEEEHGDEAIRRSAE
jgi:hypothetical protein